MGELDDPSTMCLMKMVMMLLLNLIFSNDMFLRFKTNFIGRTRASVSSTMHELSKKSKNYDRKRGMSLWKLYDKLKYQINKDHVGESMPRRSRKLRKTCFIPNVLTQSSIGLSTALRVITVGNGHLSCERSKWNRIMS